MSGEIPTNPEDVKPRESEHPRPKNIVVMDDEAALTRVYERYLKRAGGSEVTVHTFNEAQRLIDYLRGTEQTPEHRPDLLLTDRDLDSGKTAEDVIRSIRGEMPWLAGMRIVGMTGKSVAELRAAGVERVFEKPFPLQELGDYLFPKKPA